MFKGKQKKATNATFSSYKIVLLNILNNHSGSATASVTDTSSSDFTAILLKNVY
jgi:hypothetical protein